MLIFLSMILPVMLQALKLHMMSSGTKTGAIKDGMKLKKLGSSDLMVSEICLGTMTWGVQNTVDEGCAQMDYYFDECGGNFMDTAEMYAFDVSYESLYLLIIHYSFLFPPSIYRYPVPTSAETQGRTDECINKWLTTRKRDRSKIILASKICGASERITW